jgi:UDP-galactopyranose mutase
MKIILGAGLAGLSAAYHTSDKYLIIEKESNTGGLCRSWGEKGYVFDYGPHILYTRSQYVKKLLKTLLRDNIIGKERKNYIFLYNTYVKYPFETFLAGLPNKVIEDCIIGALNRGADIKPKNFKEWVRKNFGSGIAKHYMIPYNEKIWKYPLDKMSIEWVEGRVPTPDVGDMIKGAIGTQDRDFGPNAVFWYPKKSGIGALPTAFQGYVKNIRLNSKVISIKPKKNGVEIKYKKDKKIKTIVGNAVVSTLPLPDLVDIMPDMPTRVERACKKLVYNSLLCAGIGIKRTRIIDKHSLYYPEKKYLFHRLSFPMNISKETTPKNRSSILVEVTYQKNRNIDLIDAKERILNDLRDVELIKKNDIVEVSRVLTSKYAYIIYDLEHRKNVDIIHNYLKENRIIPAGRFAEWEYLNMDKSILSGIRAVEEAK